MEDQNVNVLGETVRQVLYSVGAKTVPRAAETWDPKVLEWTRTYWQNRLQERCIDCGRPVSPEKELCDLCVKAGCIPINNVEFMFADVLATMDPNRPLLSRTCSKCGEEKDLSVQYVRDMSKKYGGKFFRHSTWYCEKCRREVWKEKNRELKHRPFKEALKKVAVKAESTPENRPVSEEDQNEGEIAPENRNFDPPVGIRNMPEEHPPTTKEERMAQAAKKDPTLESVEELLEQCRRGDKPTLETVQKSRELARQGMGPLVKADQYLDEVPIIGDLKTVAQWTGTLGGCAAIGYAAYKLATGGLG